MDNKIPRFSYSKSENLLWKQREGSVCEDRVTNEEKAGHNRPTADEADESLGQFLRLDDELEDVIDVLHQEDE